MNMDSYKVELNKEFVTAKKFFNENSEDLQELKRYIDMLFEKEKVDKETVTGENDKFEKEIQTDLQVAQNIEAPLFIN